MSDQNESSWSLNLDSTEAEKSVELLQTGLQQIGATDLSELSESLTKIGTVVGVVGAAVLAIRESFKLVFDAEEIQSVEQQFDVLAKNAGLFGSTLKTALEQSAGGLVDETSLLKGASGAMVALGQNSAKLPEIMTLARQATAVFGGDLMQNFDGIAQAIASGNTRMLKHLGIVVDQNKAYEDYAKSIGVATDELSNAGKQHALLNAVLAKGKEAYAGVDTSIKQATNAWTMFKVAMTEVGDMFAIAWNKIFGPTVVRGLQALAESAHYVANFFKEKFGSGLEAAGASVENLESKLKSLENQKKMLESAPKGLYDPNQLILVNKQIDETNAKLGKQKAVLADLTKEDQQNAETFKATAAAQTRDSEVNLEKRKADQLKFKSDLDKLRAQNDAAELKSATSIEQVVKASEDRKVALKKAAQDQIAAYDKRYDLSAKQRADMDAQINKNLSNQLAQEDLQLEQQKIQSLNNLEKKNTDVATKVGNAWKAESQKAAIEMQDFTKIAVGSFTTVQSNAVSAFEAMGDGSKSAGDAMKGFMFSSLGSIAESAGSVMLAEGVWPPNPIALAGGAALLVLGGWLKGQGNGGGGSSPPTSSSSAGGGASTPSPVAAAQASPASAGPATSQVQQRSVSFVVQGNLYSSNEAKQEMMDLMRQATDATDYKYVQVGGSNT